MGIKVKDICRRVKNSSRELALIDAHTKNQALVCMAAALNGNASYIISQNAKDVVSARKKRSPEAMIDRLFLDEKRIKSMADSLLNIARLKDPLGEVLDTVRRPNGLVIKKVRVPIGTILVIYESRPNVTSDCAGLCIKSGNAIILRGGSEAINSNTAIYNVLNKASIKAGLPDYCIYLVKDTDRRIVNELLAQSELIDLVMPRGGEELIREVTSRARMPVIKHYKGVCHVYVDRSADLKMAEEICLNAKVQRPGVCNAMETLLVHKDIAAKFLPSMIRCLQANGVEVRCSQNAMKFGKDLKLAAEKDWHTEYLDLILSVGIVKDVGEAIRHIMKYGSYHSDAIIAKDKKAASKFLAEVDSACVYLNASTRFTDGGEFGKGAEIGISTDKIHARGPMGLEELTSYKYIIYGNGQVRK